MDYDEYFDGEESFEPPTADGGGAVDETSGSPVVGVFPFVGTVTYDEAHSATVGAAVGLLLVLFFGLAWWEAAGLLVATGLLRTLKTRLLDTGYLDFILKEPVWFIGASVLGVTGGTFLRVVLTVLG